MLDYLKARKLSKFTIYASIAIGLLVLFRLAILLFSPPGFFLDEAATGAHVVAMIQHGVNAHGEAWPLFSSSLGGGYTTPIYLYPLTVWAAIFGTSEVALRYFSEFATLASIGLLAFGIRYWLNNKGALIAGIVALALPWGWLQGSIAWDPALVPFFVTASFATFSAILFTHSQKLKLAAAIALPVSLIGLAYLYPPCRVTAPLLYLFFYGILYYKKALSIRSIVVSAIGACLLALPLAYFILQPEALERSRTLSVFYGVSFGEAVVHIITNFIALLNPITLFIYGDPNLRHATGFQGMLGVAALPAAGVLIYQLRRYRHSTFTPKHNNRHLLIVVLLSGVIFGLLGSALTNEGQPHSLRATAAWPFMALLLTVGWYIILTRYKKSLQYGALSLFVIATLAYVADLGFMYPARASESFDVNVRGMIERGEPAPYPDLSLQYYRTK